MSVMDLADKHGGIWGEHPEHPAFDWVVEVSQNETRLGYWDWVQVKLDEEKEASA